MKVAGFLIGTGLVGVLVVFALNVMRAVQVWP